MSDIKTSKRTTYSCEYDRGGFQPARVEFSHGQFIGYIKSTLTSCHFPVATPIDARAIVALLQRWIDDNDADLRETFPQPDALRLRPMNTCPLGERVVIKSRATGNLVRAKLSSPPTETDFQWIGWLPDPLPPEQSDEEHDSNEGNKAT